METKSLKLVAYFTFFGLLYFLWKGNACFFVLWWASGRVL